MHSNIDKDVALICGGDRDSMTAKTERPVIADRASLYAKTMSLFAKNSQVVSVRYFTLSTEIPDRPESSI